MEESFTVSQIFFKFKAVRNYNFLAALYICNEKENIMEWYNVRFSKVRNALIWMFVMILSLVLLNPVMEVAYKPVIGDRACDMILVFYSIALFYVLVVSAGPRWYLSVYDKNLKEKLLPLFSEELPDRIELTEDKIHVYRNGCCKTFKPAGDAEKRHMRDFTIAWMKHLYGKGLTLRGYCRKYVKPTGSPKGLHVTDFTSSLNLIPDKKAILAVKKLTVYGK